MGYQNRTIIEMLKGINHIRIGFSRKHITRSQNLHKIPLTYYFLSRSAIIVRL